MLVLNENQEKVKDYLDRFPQVLDLFELDIASDYKDYAQGKLTLEELASKWKMAVPYAAAVLKSMLSSVGFELDRAHTLSTDIIDIYSVPLQEGLVMEICTEEGVCHGIPMLYSKKDEDTYYVYLLKEQLEDLIMDDEISLWQVLYDIYTTAGSDPLHLKVCGLSEGVNPSLHNDDWTVFSCSKENVGLCLEVPASIICEKYSVVKNLPVREPIFSWDLGIPTQVKETKVVSDSEECLVALVYDPKAVSISLKFYVKSEVFGCMEGEEQEFIDE